MENKTDNIQRLLKQIKENKRQIINLIQADKYNNSLNAMNYVRHELDTEASILFPEKLSKPEKTLKMDYNNLANMAEAWIQIVKSPNNTVIDSYSIRNMHKLLCRDTDNTTGGIYRISNSFAMRRQSPDYNKLLYKMNDIEYKLSANYKMVQPIVITALDVHSDIIETQPFHDFNKRTARMIMNWVLFKNYYSPILFNCQSDKKLYMDNLRASLDGNKDQYYQYMLNCMLRTQGELIRLLSRTRTI